MVEALRNAVDGIVEDLLRERVPPIRIVPYETGEKVVASRCRTSATT
jgi:hypothetical protein